MPKTAVKRNTPLSDVDEINQWTFNVLANNDISTLGDLCSRTKEKVESLPRMGVASRKNLEEAMDLLGVRFEMTDEEWDELEGVEPAHRSSIPAGRRGQNQAEESPETRYQEQTGGEFLTGTSEVAATRPYTADELNQDIINSILTGCRCLMERNMDQPMTKQALAVLRADPTVRHILGR